jgi:CheY-like chemotaxis protein
MKKILIVDDDAEIRTMLTLALQEEGYEVVTAPDGGAAMDYLTRVRPDLVISDMMMPGVDGPRLISQMKARFGPRAAPVVAMTAVHELKYAGEAPFAAVVEKPFDLNLLLDTISTLTEETPR